PAENISQNARNGEDPVPVRYAETDFGGDGLCRIHRATLMAGRADTALLAGKGEQVVVVAMVASHPQESLGEVTAAEEAFKYFLQFRSQRSEDGLVLGGVGLEEIVKGGFQALPQGRGFGLAGAVRFAHPSE
ncbi:MAG: hypothetical protein O3C20_08540, partial [Verrucomicrobia bacterium]|nr:hypothetical protein [Verrucomicrobiota bacterium]